MRWCNARLWSIGSALMLAGCGSTRLVYHHPGGFDLLIKDCRTRGIGEEECNRLTPVTLTSDSNEWEAWQYEARVQMNAVGISFGQRPVDVVVIGPQVECERVRQRDSAMGLTTEPCTGPIRFKLE